MRRAWLFEYCLPLKVPFRFQGRELGSRSGLILRLCDGMSEGFAEIAPLPGFSRETLSEAKAELIPLIERWCSNAEAGAMQSAGSLLCPSVAFGWSLAQQELIAGTFQPRRRLPSALLLGAPLAALDEEVEQARRLHADARVAKIKVGRLSLEEDIARLARVSELLPGVRLRLDANRSWTLQELLQLHSALPQLPVAFVEEPLRNLQELPAMARATGWGYALDESLQQPDFVLEPQPGMVALVLKPMLYGSLPCCQALVLAAASARLELVVSSSFESSLGNTQLRALAERWAPGVAPGLDTLKHFQFSDWARGQFRTEQTDAGEVLRCLEHWHGSDYAAAASD